MRNNIKSLVLCMLVAVIITGCTQAPKEPLTKTTYALGTVITINLFDEGDETLMSSLVTRVTEIEQLMSMQQTTSELSAITEAAGREAVLVSEETYIVIKEALKYAQLSEGSFDPTVAPIIKLWSIGTEDARLPEVSEIDQALAYVDYSLVELSDTDRSVYLPLAGMSLDLGSIAKGYAADEVVRLLKEADVKKAMIDLGGNIYAHGLKDSGDKWNVGVQTPYDTRNTYFGYVTLNDMTVVTSGPYERYFEQDDQLYHHIFDANTGYPVVGDVVSVTIVAKSSMQADAMSTLLFTKTMVDGLELIESMEGIECLYLDKDYNITLSSGLKDIFTLTDKSYTLLD